MSRRALLAATPAAPTVARAQGSGPIRLIVPFAPGGATDSSARAVADKLSAALGRPVVVENRSGAGGSLGAAAAAQARPDGTMLLLDTIAHLVHPLVLRNPPVDHRTAFTPITQLTRLPLALAVKPDSPAPDLAGYVERAKASPGGVSRGNSGAATAAHLASALLQSRAGIRLNDLSDRGGSDAVRDLAAGVLDSVSVALLSVAPLARSGRARLLAVASPSRTALQPDVPTLAESYPGTSLDEWTGLFAPAGTPAASVPRGAGRDGPGGARPGGGRPAGAVGRRAGGQHPGRVRRLLPGRDGRNRGVGARSEKRADLSRPLRPGCPATAGGSGSWVDTVSS